jgi:hypothetical protein
MFLSTRLFLFVVLSDMITKICVDPLHIYRDRTGEETLFQCEICHEWYHLYLNGDYHLTDGRTVCKHCFRADPTLEMSDFYYER